MHARLEGGKSGSADAYKARLVKAPCSGLTGALAMTIRIDPRRLR